MCGLIGAVGPGARRPKDGGASILRHRGPDDEGNAEGPGWWLGFRRLSILDLSPTGHQPMSTPDAASVIVLNGEIYNYLELKADLESRGETFRGTSDTEVLLALLRREGAAALGRLNGMFAFAFVDLRARTFLVARDRLGVKPLFIQRRPGEIRFASELKALLAFPDALRSLNERALATYLGLGYVAGTETIFSGFERLGSGQLIEGQLDEPEKAASRTWWSRRASPVLRQKSDSDVLDELEALLADATRIRLRSDVPVGVFLSGGIDSGLTAAFGARVAPGLGALTVTWEGGAEDESALAAQSARAAGVEHELLPVRPAEIGMVDEICWYFDEPFADASSLPTFLLCRAARRRGTVFLAGDGGDEAFGGYGRYLGALRNRWAGHVPAWMRRGLAALGEVMNPLSMVAYRLMKMSLPEEGFAAAYDGVPQDPALALALGSERADWMSGAGTSLWTEWERSRGHDLLPRMQQLDYGLYLPDDILVKVDRAAMANSIEVRSPFLDFRVVEFAAQLPWTSLADGNEGKKPLRALARRCLPEAVARGTKMGFGVPLDGWFRRPDCLRWLRERLLSPEARRRGLWSLEGVERLLRHQETARGRDLSSLLWRLLVLDSWSRWYLDSDAFRTGPSPADSGVAGGAV